MLKFPQTLLLYLMKIFSSLNSSLIPWLAMLGAMLLCPTKGRCSSSRTLCLCAGGHPDEWTNAHWRDFSEIFPSTRLHLELWAHSALSQQRFQLKKKKKESVRVCLSSSLEVCFQISPSIKPSFQSLAGSISTLCEHADHTEQRISLQQGWRRLTWTWVWGHFAHFSQDVLQDTSNTVVLVWHDSVLLVGLTAAFEKLTANSFKKHNFHQSLETLHPTEGLLQCWHCCQFI